MAMIFRAVVFTFIPTAIELALVSWLLARSFSPSVAALVVATFVAYVGWTTLMTKVPGAHGLCVECREARVDAFKPMPCFGVIDPVPRQRAGPALDVN